jgi:hypothetical protein
MKNYGTEIHPQISTPIRQLDFNRVYTPYNALNQDDIPGFINLSDEKNKNQENREIDMNGEEPLLEGKILFLFKRNWNFKRKNYCKIKVYFLIGNKWK